MELFFLVSLVRFVLNDIAFAEGEACTIADPVDLGTVEDPRIDEASGLVASRSQPGVLFTHNDSGDEARVFALASNGDALGEYSLEGVFAYDFEDITIGAGPVDGQSYLYVADFGNNLYTRKEFQIYRFQEPDLTISQNGSFVIPAENITKIRLTTENAPTEDMETLMLDPITKDLYIVSKNHDLPQCNIYRVTPPQVENPTTITMDTVGSLPFDMIVAGDISPDGTRIALRRAIDDSGFLWDRDPGISVEETMLTMSYCNLSLTTEPQGEAIAFAPDNSGFFTTSERVHQPIYFYQLL